MARPTSLIPSFFLLSLFYFLNLASSTTNTHQDPQAWSPERVGWEFHSGFNFTSSIIQRRGLTSQLERIGDVYADLVKRQNIDPNTGALYCTSGACTDGSCCGPQGICGYGPDFCGTGCTSNCDATAMCGIYSEGGTQKCGMDLCCSYGGWCGTTVNHCIGPDQFSPCQQGFGKCEIIRPSTCGDGSGTANGRTIGYYQASNTRDRACNHISPSQIVTTGYTHLYFAFASINPSTYQITPSNPADTTLMTEFTALKSSTLETWIAIGGFDFSDVGSTHTTWSDLCADPTKRATFISSVQSYMETYGFQGVDIDWEYPVAPDRGGSPGDTTNFVSLIQEMRAAFGTSYGISITLAPDYWYLRYFDAISMEPYVDWFGFMAYDLHGSWDANIPALGALVRGQADIREIYNDTLPLFYDGLTPSKINMGIALYGRGYTLSDPSCNTLGCGFTGPSMPAPCTNTPGVMSLAEIQSFISLNGVQPTLLSDAMMKQITWADQWIGYDDADTIAMKKQFANNLCFGGTMAWSVDFNSGEGDGSQSPVSTDGSCGSVNGGTVCTGSGFGDCCSASGWCGSTDAYCGSGCQGNACIVGGLTTDGRCGVGNNGATCDGWASGTCCSASGWCGSTDAYCGAGNQPVYNAGNDGSSGAGGSTGGDNGSSGAGGSTGGASSSGSAGGSSTVSAGSSSTSSTQGSSTAVPPRCLLPSGADSGTIVETDTNRCMTQGPGEWTFGMHLLMDCVPSPDKDPSNDFNGCTEGNNFNIYDENCAIRGGYTMPDCGTPFSIEETFLPDVLTVTAVFLDVGRPYFSFLYGDGEYSIRNNHCVCVNDGGGLEVTVACRCAFPIDGHFVGKRSVEIEA